MRRFITDTRLHIVLEEIESALGYAIPAEPMNKRQAGDSVCLIEYWDDDGYVFRYPEGVPLKQTTICHELMHPILRLEGWPYGRISDKVPRDSIAYKAYSLAGLFVEHPMVWERGTALGFPENADHVTYLQATVLPALTALPATPNQERMTEQLCYLIAWLAQALLLPEGEDQRTTVECLARNRCPQALEAALFLVRHLRSALPLTPQSCPLVLGNICKVLRIPKEMLWPEVPPAAFPRLFSDVLRKVNQGTSLTR